MDLRVAPLDQPLLGNRDDDEQQADERTGHTRAGQEEVVKACWCHTPIWCRGMTVVQTHGRSRANAWP